MFIKSLTIKNFRCFGKGIEGEGVKIDLNKGLTAFIGRNGSGKTAILEALNLLIGSDYLPTKINEKDFHKEASGIKSDDAIVIEGETEHPFYVSIDVVSNSRAALTVSVPCNRIKLFIKRREKAEKVLDDPFRIEKTVIPIVGDIDDIVYQGHDIKKSYKVVSLSEAGGYYEVKYKTKSSGEERIASFPSYNLGFNPSRIKGLAKSYYLGKERDRDVAGNYSLITKILTDLHWRYIKRQAGSSSDSIQEEYSTLAESLRDIVDEKNVLIKNINDKVRSICCGDENFQIDFMDIDQPYKMAFIAKTEGNKLLLPDNLGSGFNILIAYALFSYVVDREKIPIVLIIDEPELHLHSDWQKKMYNIFTEQKDIQVVYSTQSEKYISLKNWEQIRAISDSNISPKKEVLQEKVAAVDDQVGTREDYLNDYAKRNLHISAILSENLELFFTKKCILVEGPSEKYGLIKLLELSGCDVEKYSFSVIPTWGKTKMKSYQMICKVFGIDYFTVFDSDKGTSDESLNENTVIEGNSQDGKITKFSTNFEAILGVADKNKFQKLVNKIDKLIDTSTLDQEIKDCVNNLKTFIESNEPSDV